MSLGRTGTMWLIQPNLPLLSYIHKCRQKHARTHAHMHTRTHTLFFFTATRTQVNMYSFTCFHMYIVRINWNRLLVWWLGRNKHKTKNLAPFDFRQTSTTQLHCTHRSFSALLLYWLWPQLSTFLKHCIKWIPPLLDNKYRRLAKSCYSSA